MKKIVSVFLVAALVGFAVMVFAQAPPNGAPKPAPAVAPAAPVLSEVDALKVENAFLKIDQQQRALDKMKADFQALLASLQKPGFVITQGQDGKLAYVVEPKPPEMKK